MSGGKTPDGRGLGRKPGSKNVRTKQLEALIAAQQAKLDEFTAKPFEGDAHAFLILAYKDTTLPMKDRLAAAQAAIRYEKPALASEERRITGEIGVYRAIPVAERDALPMATIAQELIED